MEEMYWELLSLFNNAPRYRYPTYAEEIQELNGIYVQFENGENINGLERVVRFGTHTKPDRLLKRLDKHYLIPYHRSSSFRCHLGRCVLNHQHNDYHQYWRLKIPRIPAGFFNPILEQEIEHSVTQYIRNNTSFCVIPDLSDKKERERIETGLIALFAQSHQNIPSNGWIGLSHPQYPVMHQTGLWNIDDINANILTEEEFETVQQKMA